MNIIKHTHTDTRNHTWVCVFWNYCINRRMKLIFSLSANAPEAYIRDSWKLVRVCVLCVCVRVVDVKLFAYRQHWDRGYVPLGRGLSSVLFHSFGPIKTLWEDWIGENLNTYIYFGAWSCVCAYVAPPLSNQCCCFFMSMFSTGSTKVPYSMGTSLLKINVLGLICFTKIFQSDT